VVVKHLMDVGREQARLQQEGIVSFVRVHGDPHERNPRETSRDLGLTSRQEAREGRIVTSLKPFRWNPAGNQSRPVELGQQPEAGLVWWVGNHPRKA
jgi:Uma2 family endonuclease